ncbi:unnamed protein product, partial [Ixodes persulcatus]
MNSNWNAPSLSPWQRAAATLSFSATRRALCRRRIARGLFAGLRGEDYLGALSLFTSLRTRFCWNTRLAPLAAALLVSWAPEAPSSALGSPLHGSLEGEVERTQRGQGCGNPETQKAGSDFRQGRTAQIRDRGDHRWRNADPPRITVALDRPHTGDPRTPASVPGSTRG